MKIFYIIVIVSSIWGGCDNAGGMEIIINNNSVKIESFPENKELTFSKLIDYNEGTPFKIHEADSGIYIFDIKAKNDRVFHFYSFRENNLVSNYVNKGNGPYETFSPLSSGIKNGVLWVLDYTMHKVIEYDLWSLNEQDRQKEVKLTDYFNWIEFLNGDEIIANGLLGSSRKFQKLDRYTGELKMEFGVFEKVPMHIPGETLAYFFQSQFAVKPDGKQLVSAYRWNEAIEIFDLQTLESILIWGPENINNEFALNKDELGKIILERGGEIQHCNLDVAATDDYIFVLFSGNYDNIMDPHFSDTICVYSWDGTPITKLKIDRKIMSFSVSPDSQTLYSYDVDAGEIIYIMLDLP